MSDDYLWDGSGPIDPDVERLERLLGPLRSAPADLRLPRPGLRRIVLPLLAAAAALALMVDVGERGAPRAVPAGSWAATTLEGSPEVDGTTVDGEVRLGIGDTLVTDARSRARISSKEVGQILVDPGSRVRLVETAAGRHRLALVRGLLHAFIVAPPGQFVVDTRSATAVDLGCVYTLRSSESGDGILAVQAGWVGLGYDGRESFVPAGASCPTSVRGPGIPRFDDAADGFKRSLDEVEATGTPAERVAPLAEILATARTRDAFTLWHLLSRVSPAERGPIVAALDARVPLPGGVAPEAVLRLDRTALDRWWDALGLGDAKLWRTSAWRPLTRAGRVLR